MDVSWFHRPWRNDGDPAPSTGSTAGRRGPSRRIAVLAAVGCLALSLLATAGGSRSSTVGASTRLDDRSRPHSTSAMVRRSGGVHQTEVGRTGRIAVVVRATHDAQGPAFGTLVPEAVASGVRRQATGFAPNRAPPA